MDAATLIYLISLIDNLRIFIVVLSCLLAFFSSISGMAWIINLDPCTGNEEKAASANKIFKKSVTCGLLVFLFAAFFPNEKTMYLMIGANYLEKSGIPTKVEKVINDKLDYYLSEDRKEFSKK